MAVFRLHAPAAGGHHYATLREHAEGETRYTLELRRGLVWGFGEAIFVVAASGMGEAEHPVVVQASGEAEDSGRRLPAGDLPAFARVALRLAAARLGVEVEDFGVATHVDLGETGTLGIEPAVRERSQSLLEQAQAEAVAAKGAAPRVAASAEEPPASPTVTPGSATHPEAAGPRPDAAVIPGGEPTGAGATDRPATSAAPGAPSAPPAPVRRPSPRQPVAPDPGTAAGGDAASRPGLLGRIVGWLRRAARAAFGQR
jgi:hypothetical protein